MKYKSILLSLTTLIVSILFIGCEVSIDTEKKWGLKIKDKSPVEVYKKGMKYSEIGESEPFSGEGYKDYTFSKEFFNFKNGIKNGPSYDMTREGKVTSKSFYNDGKKHGVSFYYNYPTSFTTKSIYKNGDLIQEIQVSNFDYKIKRYLTYKNNEAYEGYNYAENVYAEENKRYLLELYSKGKFSLKYLTYKECHNREKIKDIDNLLETDY